MTTSHDLSGRWTGYYVQHDTASAIEAVFVQEGRRLVGTMNDEVTDFEASISEIALRESLPPGADEQLVAGLRTLCPEAPIVPVKVMVHRPEGSVLEGEVRGDAVRLLKRHRGRTFAGYRLGDLRIGAFGTDQRMLYRGRLSPDGGAIEGQWQAIGERLSPFHRTHGVFVLRRDPPSPSLN